jgi:hypothetical protein
MQSVRECAGIHEHYAREHHRLVVEGPDRSCVLNYSEALLCFHALIKFEARDCLSALDCLNSLNRPGPKMPPGLTNRYARIAILDQTSSALQAANDL